jgi:hypothetical protein
MSMALVTGASHSAFAKGGSKTGGDDLVYAKGWLVPISPLSPAKKCEKRQNHRCCSEN